MIINKILLELDNLFNERNTPVIFRDYIKLAVCGMVLYYGEDYYDLIINSLNEINFYYGLDDIKSNSALDIKQVENRINSGESAFTLYNISMSKRTNDGIPDIHINYSICVNESYNVNDLLFLEFIVHELNHIICSKCNSLFMDENNNVGFRNGFYMAYLKTNMQDNGKGRIFNEVINSLMTEDIITILLSLDDECLLDILDRFQKYNITQYNASGYSILTTLFRPLFNINEFKDFSKSCLMDGNIFDMKNLFDSHLGLNKYEEMIDKLDVFFEYYMKLIKGAKFANTLPFDLSRIYMDIRDNYLKEFIIKRYNINLSLK